MGMGGLEQGYFGITKATSIDVETFRPKCGRTGNDDGVDKFAPYLEELLVCVSGAIFGSLPTERHGIIKSLALQCGLYEDGEGYRKFAGSSPKLRYLVVRFCCRWVTSDFYRYQSVDQDNREMETVDMNEYWETFRLLLQSSRTSLKMIRVPTFALIARLNLDWQVFSNVTWLVLEYPLRHQLKEQAIRKALRRYEFAARFPNLRSVTMMEIPRGPKNFYNPDAEHFVHLGNDGRDSG